MTEAPALTWIGVFRLGAVQMAIGAIAVLSLSTLNRIMTVELALPAILPGLLVGVHYAVQILRPRWGYGSDKGGRRTPWIIGGMAVLALGGAGACASTALMAEAQAAGIAAAFLAYVAVGVGAGAAGTSLLALLAKEAGPRRGAVAGPIVWIMMILGFALSAGLSGRFLDPFSPARLIAVGAAVSVIAFAISLFAIWGVESEARPRETPPATGVGPLPEASFMKALRAVWQDARARRFSYFIFISMLAFSGQELLLEPLGGTVFKLTPGQTAQLSGLLHAGAFLGMIAGLAASAFARKAGMTSLGPVIAAGCAGSALGLLSLVYGGSIGPEWPIRLSVASLGFANGVYAITAIAAMMTLAASTGKKTAGTHLGVWGAAQGIASGLGGLAGTGVVDAVRTITGSPVTAYLCVFGAEAGLFLAAGWLALGTGSFAEPDKSKQMAVNPSEAEAAPAAA